MTRLKNGKPMTLAEMAADRKVAEAARKKAQKITEKKEKK
jgi:hypothetical protein